MPIELDGATVKAGFSDMARRAVSEDSASMKSVQKIPCHHFSSGFSVPIGHLGVRLNEIAEKVGLAPDSWEEHGLGRAVGMFIQLSSGRIVLLRELEHAVKYLGAPGPTIDADPTDVIAVGIEALLDEVVDSLALSRDAIHWSAGAEGERNAARMLHTLRSNMTD
jgi:hypothetical protein